MVRSSLSKNHDQESFSAKLVILALSTLMGIIGGLFAALLRFLIEFLEDFFRNIMLPFVSWNVEKFNFSYLLIPTFGGLLVGVIISKFSKESKGSGIPYLLESVTFKSAQISPRIGFFKTICTSITIGSGGNAGKEGPIALIAASFGSFFGQKLNLHVEDKRLLMTCGLAAGIAGSFKAPIGGALFGLEILYQGITLSASIPVFLASVVGVVITGIFYGFEPHFAVNFEISSIHTVEYPIFILLGVFSAGISFVHFITYRKISKWFQKIKIPFAFKPAIGGLIVGIIVMFFPSYGLYGSGFNGMQMTFDMKFTINAFFILGLLKIITASSTIGSGGSGGVFAPLLYIGCMFGGLFSLFFQILIPDSISNPTLYCILGAAAVFSTSAQAPLNICLIMAEMTGHFDVFPPLIITSISSYYTGRLFFKGASIYTLILGKKGRGLKADTLFLLGKIQVHEIMSSNLVTIASDLPILEFLHLSSIHNNLNQFPVVNFGSLEGVAFIDDVYQIPYEMWKDITVKEISRKKNVCISPNATLQEAIDKMNEFHLGALLVTDNLQQSERNKEVLLKGIITLNDIIATWHTKKVKKVE
ncbi:chloride channel protein [Candidatus Harpocratesius sp.]